jgi:hypothetical protein
MVKKTKIKRRPRRLFKDSKTDRYFYLIDGKKKFVNTGQITSQKQISKINIQNVLPVPVRRKRIRPPSDVKPITTERIVSKLVPIAPVSANLSASRLFKGTDASDVEKDKKKLEDDKKKADEEKKTIEDEKKKLDDDKKALEKEIRKLEDEKRKTEDDKRKADIEDRLRDLDNRRSAFMEDIVSLRRDKERLDELYRDFRDREQELQKREKSVKKSEEAFSLAQRLADMDDSSTGTLASPTNKSSTRIPKPSMSPALEDIMKSRDKSPIEKAQEFIRTSIAEKEAELDLTPEPFNPEEADEGDIGFSESKENTTVRESKEEPKTKKDTLKGIRKRLEGIVKEYGGTNYEDFVGWWEESSYRDFKTPTRNQFNTASMKYAYELLGYSSQAEMDNADAEEIRRRRIEAYGDAPFVTSSTATNTGSGAYANDNDGIYNDELQEIFSDKTNKFLPVIASDKMGSLLPLVDKNTKKFGWIQNTDKSSSMGRHWVAYFIDITNLEVNYFDSLVENGGEPPKESLKGLKRIIDKINPEYYLKLKTNLVMLQNPMSNNCGYFALKFIMDRYRNIPFKSATMYDKVTGYKSDDDDDVITHYGDGEKMIQKFKRYL